MAFEEVPWPAVKKFALGRQLYDDFNNGSALCTELSSFIPDANHRVG